jgi:hypothetical protein
MFNTAAFNVWPFNAPPLFAPQAQSGGVLVIDRKTISAARPKLNATIKGYIAGDDLRIERTYTKLPSGAVVQSARLIIKRRENDADGDAVLDKTITTDISDADTADAQITLKFDLTDTETALMPATREFVYRIVLTSTTGALYTPEVGCWQAGQQQPGC